MTAAASPIAADRPAHYRLSTDTWELILKEYREGATAPFLSRKWRVSQHAIRKRCTQHKATKRDWGDAQAIGQALAREAELEEARRNSPEAVTARLFDGVALGADEADPGVLARAATLASGRAMAGRLWTEAKALTGLAESYGRMAEREAKAAAAGAMTVETAPLPLIYDILSADESTLRLRFALWGDGPETEHYELRRSWWARMREDDRVASETRRRVDDRIFALKQQVRDLGGEPIDPPP